MKINQINSKQQSINFKNRKAFLDNWNFVKQTIQTSPLRPVMAELEGLPYDSLSEEEKVIAAYIMDTFSEATNRHLRSTPAPERRTKWLAQLGLTKESIPRFVEALKYAIGTLNPFKGITYRWQTNGAFQKALSDNTLQEKGFLSTGRRIQGLEEFRTSSIKKHGIHPELLIINGKSGKIIPEEVSSYRAYEQEVVFEPDKKFVLTDSKIISSENRIEGLEDAIKISNKYKLPGFSEFRAFYLDEI